MKKQPLSKSEQSRRKRILQSHKAMYNEIVSISGKSHPQVKRKFKASKNETNKPARIEAVKQLWYKRDQKQNEITPKDFRPKSKSFYRTRKNNNQIQQSSNINNTLQKTPAHKNQNFNKSKNVDDEGNVEQSNKRKKSEQIQKRKEEKAKAAAKKQSTYEFLWPIFLILLGVGCFAGGVFGMIYADSASLYLLAAVPLCILLGCVGFIPSRTARYNERGDLEVHERHNRWYKIGIATMLFGLLMATTFLLATFSVAVLNLSGSALLPVLLPMFLIGGSVSIGVFVLFCIGAGDKDARSSFIEHIKAKIKEPLAILVIATIAILISASFTMNWGSGLVFYGIVSTITLLLIQTYCAKNFYEATAEKRPWIRKFLAVGIFTAVVCFSVGVALFGAGLLPGATVVNGSAGVTTAIIIGGVILGACAAFFGDKYTFKKVENEKIVGGLKNSHSEDDRVNLHDLSSYNHLDEGKGKSDRNYSERAHGVVPSIGAASSVDDDEDDQENSHGISGGWNTGLNTNDYTNF